MRLEEQLWNYTVDDLKRLIRLLGGPGPERTRKEFLVKYIFERLTQPDTLEEMWERLDPLSQKTVAAAYHNGGYLNEDAFVAQYGARPWSRGSGIFLSYSREMLPLDLFLYQKRLPQELMRLLAPLVPPPEKFQLQGLEEAPDVVSVYGEEHPLWGADTEQAGLHDLQAHLRLFQQGVLKYTPTSGLLTAPSARILLDNLLEGDFLPHVESPKLADTIRPFGLDIFVRESGLVRNSRTRKLSDEGEALLRHQDTEALLYAFETWANQGKFDELSRIPAIKGQKSRYTRLTPPAARREAIVEALSWCPTEVWISVSDFMRALKIWHFDFELDLSDYSGLYVGDSIYGRLTESGGWTTAKRLDVNAMLWEYLGSIGALDLPYLPPDEAYLDFEYHDIYDEYYSLYDGLAYFRINPLGAYLLGQADEYVPSQPTDVALFSTDPTLVLTLKDPSTLTPNLLNQLAQFTVEEDSEHYRLDNQQVLNALESGSNLEQIADFLVRRHEGPLPTQVTDWLEEVKANSRAFKSAGKALFIRASSQALLQLATEDPTLSKFAKRLEGRTLVIPANREKVFRERLKELGYLLA